MVESAKRKVGATGIKIKSMKYCYPFILYPFQLAYDIDKFPTLETGNVIMFKNTPKFVTVEGDLKIFAFVFF